MSYRRFEVTTSEVGWGRGLERSQVGVLKHEEVIILQTEIFAILASDGLGGRIWGHPAPLKSRSPSNFWLQSRPRKMLLSMIFWYPKFNISVDGLEGRRGRSHIAYNLRTNEVLLHGKFQPPSFNGVAVHRSQAEGQTKRGLSNICLDLTQIGADMTIFLVPYKVNNNRGW